MSRACWVLLLVLAAETLVGGWLVAARLRRPLPPEADWTLLDPATVAQLQEACATCSSAEDWCQLAELYMAAGCFAESAACHGVACELAPDDARLARQWGFALERLARFDEANAQYQHAIDLGSTDPDACRYFIARNHLRQEDATAARRVFTEGRALAANRYELARLDRHAGALTPAADWLRGVAAARPNALQVQLLAYRLAQDRGDARQALVAADRVRYAPEKLLTPFDEEAERIVHTTQHLGPQRIWKAVSERLNAGQLDEAAQLLADADRQEHSPAVVELRAELALRRGQFDVALRHFEEFLEQNGPSGRISARMGDVWDAAGEPAQARQHWLRAAGLGAGVDLKAAHHKLAQSFAQAGDATAAAHHLARGHYFVGRDLLQLGHPDKALAYFAAATRHDPAWPAGWFYLGEARRRSGERDPAITAYCTCLRLHPGHGRALAGLALLAAEPMP